MRGGGDWPVARGEASAPPPVARIFTVPYFRRVYEIFIPCTSVPSGAFMNIVIVR
jgi:hypothetical protein